MSDSLRVALDALARARMVGIVGAVALGLSAFAVPVAAFALLARSRLAGGVGWRAAQRTVGSLVTAAYGVLAAGMAANYWRRAETPAKVRVAKALGEPVIVALERYRAEHLEYPADLRLLVPRYLPAAALAAAERSPLARPFEWLRFHVFLTR